MMMQTRQYSIAGWGVRISIDVQDVVIDELLSSYVPFIVSDKVFDSLPLVCDIRIGRDFGFVIEGDEIGKFDSGGVFNGVYRTDKHYFFTLNAENQPVCYTMRATADFANVEVQLAEGLSAQSLVFAANNAAMLSYAFATAPRDTLLMHSSVIRNRSVGYMFLGVSGTGKSTHTRLWRENIPCSDLLNDDNPAIRVVDGEVRVYGTPWSGKTPCYRQLNVPVGAITMLEQRPYNRIKRQPVLASLAALLPSASNMKWDKRVNDGVLNTMTKVIKTVPIYLLGCLPDAEAARTSFNEFARR